VPISRDIVSRQNGEELVRSFATAGSPHTSPPSSTEVALRCSTPVAVNPGNRLAASPASAASLAVGALTRIGFLPCLERRLTCAT
jgi:hypothetical protein